VERSAAGVHGRELRLIPETTDATSFSWMGSIRGWCISGQFWIGHRIPAYKLTLEGGIPEEVKVALTPDEQDEGAIWIVALTEEEAMEKAMEMLGESVPKEAIKLEQDEDVLDLRFSSRTIPFHPTIPFSYSWAGPKPTRA
jgi:valyl-tRNA synthetase